MKEKVFRKTVEVIKDQLLHLPLRKPSVPSLKREGINETARANNHFMDMHLRIAYKR